jgi:hypothetical protein
VDRGALDAALELGFPCGGWCPEARMAEDGRIPDRYPLKVLPGAGYVERTWRNVVDSDGTAIIYFGELQGGTQQTVQFCIEKAKPYKLIDAEKVSEKRAGELLDAFVRQHRIRILNVAGPRLSKVPREYDYAFKAIKCLLQSADSK